MGVLKQWSKRSDGRGRTFHLGGRAPGILRLARLRYKTLSWKIREISARGRERHGLVPIEDRLAQKKRTRESTVEETNVLKCMFGVFHVSLMSSRSLEHDSVVPGDM